MANARIDASQVDAFARRLDAAARLIEQEGDRFEEEWGGKWAEEMRSVVRVDSGTLRDSIEQGAPGDITMVGYARFLEYGTARMSPHPFIRPAMKRIQKPAKADAGDRAVKLMQRGR